MMPVGVVGASGFLGGEVVRLLATHPRAEVVARVANRSAGKRLSEVRPGLRGPADGLLEAFDADALAERCELVFLALPHGTSAQVGRELRARDVAVIDLGSDFRLVDPADHRRYYGREPGAPELLDGAVYSLPELTGAPVGADLIANPGCFATALSLLLAPLAPLVSGPVSLFGVTGSSGSGVSPSTGVHHSLRVSSFKAYKTLRHQHMGEVRQLLARRGGVPELRFVPHSLPAVRGIHLTAMVSRADLSGDPAAAYAAAYGDAALVDLTEGEIHLGGVVGSCHAVISLSGDDDTLVVFAAIDNLLKGGSGQAVQNLNLRQGWPETLGLPVVGSWP
jgi:N-acetyl-gamma-glutamyl-phosphate reductase